VISLEAATKIYTISREHQVTAVRDISLTIARGEFMIITGRSGSGKTTLLNLVAGLTPPTSGRVLWQELEGGRSLDLWALSDRKRSRLRNERVGFVFQFPSLLPALTVLENVTLPTIFSANGEGPATRERGSELLHTVGLADKLGVYPRQLSAGQQQRVVVARALFNQPQVLLADEPTSDLDERTEGEIMDLFAEVHAQTGVTIVMVTHTTQLVRYGTRHLRMAEGQVVGEGDSRTAG
jgi:ABC-type lipoprotein export system ATPase subunit